MRSTARYSLAAIIAIVIAAASLAAIRAPGRYSGVVVFDRWDGCTLSSGVFVMYVSEAVKERLREHAGKYVTVDAKEVYQPINPGEGLIKRFEIIAAAAEPRDPPNSPSPFRLTARLVLQDARPPAVVIEVKNDGEEPATLHYGSLAPTLLARKKEKHELSPSDGPSWALITSQSFWSGSDDGEPRLVGEGASYGTRFRWTVINRLDLPRQEVLRPKEKAEVALLFELPVGEYDFFAGYGDSVHAGRSVTSNLVAFDVAGDGSAKPIEVKGR